MLDAACFPSQFGCTDDVAKYSYDPDKARHLLAEAGFAGGFEVPLLSWASHTEVEAVVADLAKVGVTVKVRLLQSPVVRKMMSDGEATLAMISWGSYSINDVSASTSLYFDGGGYDMARDAQVTQWLKEGDNSTDAEARERSYKQALQRIAEQVYWLPVTSQVTNYAYTEDLEFTPSFDEIPNFFSARWV